MKLLITFPITFLLVYRAWSHSSLTPVGIVFAALTALIHGTHPSPLPFTLLCIFFLAGTQVTKVKAALKEGFTTAAGGRSGGKSHSKPQGQDQGVKAKGKGNSKAEIKGEKRNHIQVLANSGIASLLCLVHIYSTRVLNHSDSEICVPSLFPPPPSSSLLSPGLTKPPTPLFPTLLLTGILANYASVAADTFSSELGILALSSPRLITKPWLTVPRGTNGGVTAWGVFAGFMGAGIVGAAGAVVGLGCSLTRGGNGKGGTETGYSDWRARSGVGGAVAWILAVAVWGTCGSLLDSLLGALFQASVVETRTGKIVEGEGGGKVLVAGSVSDKRPGGSGGDVKVGSSKGSRKVLVGRDWLSNNQVNLLMAGVMSFGGMGLVASWSGGR